MKNVIYAIRNLENGRMYVGSAVHLGNRTRQHLGGLRRGTHHSIKLQRAWNKYGEERFVFEVLEFVSDKGSMLAREQHWIDTLSAVKNGYNILPTAGSPLGAKHTEETRAKMSKARMGVPVSAEARQKISAFHKGRKHPPEKGRKHSATMTGRKPSPEHSTLRNAALRSPEVRAKISASSKGRVKSPEHMEKIRQALARPEVKAKLRERNSSRKGTTQTPEQKEHLRQKALARWQDPELRAKFVAARQARAKKS